MDRDLYHVEAVDSSNMVHWDELYSKSRQHTLFMRDDYLSIIGYDTRKYLVYRKDRVCAGICLPIEKGSGKSRTVVPYAPYQGLLFAQSDDSYADYHNNLEATDFLLDYLYESKEYDSIGFSNSVSVKDVRAIQWHHYHKPELGMYNIQIRYTSIANVKDSLSIEKGLSKGRKLDYKYSKERYGLSCIYSDNLKAFMGLYVKTFERQGISLSCNDVMIVENLVKLLIKTGEGELCYAVDSQGRELDASFLVYDGECAYYLFGANDPEYRKYGGGTLLLVDQMKCMSEKGISKFDFIGINSPQRGDYKLSYGGVIVPYYVCSVQY